MKNRVYIVTATSGGNSKDYMVEAPTAAQAVRHITRRIYTVKPATGIQVAEFLKAGRIIETVPPFKKAEPAKGPEPEISSEKIIEEAQEAEQGQEETSTPDDSANL